MAGEVVDIVDGNNLTIGHATQNGFTPSTPVGDLTISEDAIDGTSVGFIIPHESPDGIEDVFTFRLNNAGGPFEIDPDTGEITIADASQLDFETSATHELIVEVEDDQGNIIEEGFTVAVNDVNDVNPLLDLSSGISLNTDGGNDAYLILSLIHI